MFQTSSEQEGILQLPDVALIPLQFSKIIKPGGTLPISSELLDALEQVIASKGVSMTDVLPLIAADPIVGLRVIAEANSERFPSVRPYVTLQDAIGRIGPGKLYELLSEMAEVKPMASAFYGRGIALMVFQQLILTGIISRRVLRIMLPELSDYTMASVISGANLLALTLCAYSRPNYFSGCIVNAQLSDKGSFDKELRRLFGSKQPSAINESILDKMGIPEDICTAVGNMHVAPWNRKAWQDGTLKNSSALLASSYIAAKVTEEIVACRGEEKVTRVIRDNFSRANLPRGTNDGLLNDIETEYLSEVGLLGLCPLRLPDYLPKEPYEHASTVVDLFPRERASFSERINPFLYELRACFMTRPEDNEFHRFSQVIYSTLLALVRGLNFDRAIYFAYASQSQMLAPVFIFGEEVSSPEILTTFIRPNEEEQSPHIHAALERKPVFYGDPLIEGYWPFVAFPAYTGDDLMGVFYADKKERDGDSEGLTVEEQVACIAISEEWYEINPGFF
jgi:hypothetical protein